MRKAGSVAAETGSDRTSLSQSNLSEETGRMIMKLAAASTTFVGGTYFVVTGIIEAIAAGQVTGGIATEVTFGAMLIALASWVGMKMLPDHRAHLDKQQEQYVALLDRQRTDNAATIDKIESNHKEALDKLDDRISAKDAQLVEVLRKLADDRSEKPTRV